MCRYLLKVKKNEACAVTIQVKTSKSDAFIKLQVIAMMYRQAMDSLIIITSVQSESITGQNFHEFHLKIASMNMILCLQFAAPSEVYPVN